MSDLPRGLRNNNPGNIVKSSIQFAGEVDSTDSRFKAFQSRAWGYRAMFTLLGTYISKGYDTIAEIINRWAPPIENNTEGYISFVEKQTGINRNTKLTINSGEEISKIVAAISWKENGIKATMSEVNAGFDLQTKFKKKAL